MTTGPSTFQDTHHPLKSQISHAFLHRFCDAYSDGWCLLELNTLAPPPPSPLPPPPLPLSPTSVVVGRQTSFQTGTAPALSSSGTLGRSFRVLQSPSRSRAKVKSSATNNYAQYRTVVCTRATGCPLPPSMSWNQEGAPMYLLSTETVQLQPLMDVPF